MPNAAVTDVERAEKDGTTGTPTFDARDLLQMVTVDGTVADQDGRPAAGVFVRACTGDKHEPVAKSDAQGLFQLRFHRHRAPGLAILARTADETQQAFFAFDWNLSSRDVLPAVRLKLSPPQSISVQVVDQADKPVRDAVIGLVVNDTSFGSGRSDEQGKLTLRVPAGTPLQNIYALKPPLGLDYLSFPKAKRTTAGDLPKAPDLSQPVILKLTAARTV
jgi:hypothetical protein